MQDEDSLEQEDEARELKRRIQSYQLCALLAILMSVWLANLVKSRWGIDLPPDILVYWFFFTMSPSLISLFIGGDHPTKGQEKWAKRFLVWILGTLSLSTLFIPGVHVARYGLEHTGCLFNSDEWQANHGVLHGVVIGYLCADGVVCVKEAPQEPRVYAVGFEALPWYEARQVDTTSVCPFILLPVESRLPVPGERIAVPVEYCVNPARRPRLAPSGAGRNSAP
ncbi:MAG: hypothetical protein WC641_02855 [Patescibacteria group bacterium]